MDHALEVFMKENISPGELEEIWGKQGVDRLKELLEENQDKYETLKNNEIIKNVSILTNSNCARSIYLTFMEYQKLKEVKEGYKQENIELLGNLNLEKSKREEYEIKLKENKLITEENINEFEKLKKGRILSYSSKNKRKPLSRYSLL